MKEQDLKIDWEAIKASGYNSRTLRFVNGFAILQKNDKVGIMNTLGQIVAPCIYDDFEKQEDTIFTGKVLILKKGTKWGALNPQGKTIIPFEYEKVQYSHEAELLIVERYNKTGLKTLKGKTLLPIDFDDIEIGKTGKYCIIQKGDKKGVLDLKNNCKLIIDLVYEEVEHTFIELFHVTKNGKIGLVDTFNKIVVPIEFEKIQFRSTNDYFIIHKNEQQALYGANGKQLTEFGKYDSIEYFTKNLFKITKNKKEGLLKVSGQELVEPKFHIICQTDNHENEHKNTIAFANLHDDGITIKGYIDRNGKFHHEYPG